MDWKDPNNTVRPTDDDDLPVGRILSRRELLALLGAAGVVTASGAGLLVARRAAPVAAQETATTLPACVVRPEVTEGPYYVDEDLLRADIRSDPATGLIKEGTPLQLTFQVMDVDGGACTPLPNAEVEVWHCDAAGVYSDVTDPGFSTVGQQWLRGSLITDDSGLASFTTIYPGWYAGRAVHIHFKVRPDTTSVFTSQLFFDDALSDRVFAAAPYAAAGQRRTLNRVDGIYRSELLLDVTETADGYQATFPIGIDRSTLGTGQPPGGRGAPGAGRPPGGR
jgi:protocatechuate 3,4-dioxygenase beta subunit